MAHFLGDVSGSRGKASRLGTKKSGMTARVMSWSGMVRVDIHHDETTGEDRFTVTQEQHPSNGAGIREEIASGIIGEPTKKETPRPGLIGELHAALVTAEKMMADGDWTTEEMHLVRAAIKKAEG